MFKKAKDWTAQFEGILKRLEAVETLISDGKEPDETTVEHGDRIAHLEGIAEGMSSRFEDLVLAVDEGIVRSERAHRRIQATVTRARKELRDSGFTDPGLEAENEDLALERVPRDDSGIPTIGLQSMPTSVDTVAETPSSVKGVSIETLQRARGISA